MGCVGTHGTLLITYGAGRMVGKVWCTTNCGKCVSWLGKGTCKMVGKFKVSLEVKFSEKTGKPVVKGKVSKWTGKYTGIGSGKVGWSAK